MVFWESSSTPWCPRAGAEGVRELLWAPRGAARIHLRPRSHFRGPLGTRFGVLRSRLRTKFGSRGVVCRQKLPSSTSRSGFNSLG